ncbi:hypothetical protein ACWD4P_15535 [Kitasatospora sp. NPDC002543]
MNGTLLVVVAILLQSLSNGLLSDDLGGGESLLLSFTAFGASALVFGLVNRLRRAGRPRESLRGAPLRLMLLLNAATAVTFLGFYTSLTLAPAPLATAVETGIGPAALAVAGLRRPTAGAAHPRRLALGSLALALALAAAVRAGGTGSEHTTAQLSAGLALAGVAGVTAAGIAVLSHRLGGLGVSPVTVTAHRFHLTYLLALVLLLGPGPGLHATTAGRAAFIGLIAVLGVALPLFVLQIGMQRTAPMAVTLLASAVPGLTYLTATLVGRQSFDLPVFLLVNGSLLLAFLGPVLLRARPSAARNGSTTDLPGPTAARPAAGPPRPAAARPAAGPVAGPVDRARLDL